MRPVWAQLYKVCTCNVNFSIIFEEVLLLGYPVHIVCYQSPRKIPKTKMVKGLIPLLKGHMHKRKEAKKRRRKKTISLPKTLTDWPIKTLIIFSTNSCGTCPFSGRTSSSQQLRRGHSLHRVSPGIHIPLATPPLT